MNRKLAWAVLLLIMTCGSFSDYPHIDPSIRVVEPTTASAISVSGSNVSAGIYSGSNVLRYGFKTKL
jgi:hypothetical protein